MKNKVSNPYRASIWSLYLNLNCYQEDLGPDQDLDEHHLEPGPVALPKKLGQKALKTNGLKDKRPKRQKV